MALLTIGQQDRLRRKKANVLTTRSVGMGAEQLSGISTFPEFVVAMSIRCQRRRPPQYLAHRMGDRND